MRFPPFAVAFDNDDYYFLPPDWVKREVEDLKEFNTAIMVLNIRLFPPAKTYAEILKEIVVFVTSNVWILRIPILPYFRYDLSQLNILFNEQIDGLITLFTYFAWTKRKLRRK